MVQFGREGVARSIFAAIRDQIHAGTYKAGDRLPSTRALAAEWGVARTTVTAAYGQLVAEGYLVSRPGARAVVAGSIAPPQPSEPVPAMPPLRLSAFANRLLSLPVPAQAAAARIADFRYGDLAASDFPVLAWRRALTRASLRKAARLRYDDPRGLAELRAALQGYLWRARGIACSCDRIMIVNGSQQALDLCARLLIDPGQPFVIENPGYALARQVFAAAGGVPLPAPVDEDGLRTADLPPARLAYVTPSHQFPLGGVLPASRRRELLAWAARNDACIVEDDYDGEYRHGVAPVPPLQSHAPDRVIYVGTFSKTLSPTLRLGYLIAPPALCDAFAAAKRLTDRHTALPEQQALADLLLSGAYERHLRSIRRRNAERRAVLLQALAAQLGDSARIAGTDTGLHVVLWLKGAAATREAGIAAAAREAGVGLYPVSPLYDAAAPRPPEAGFILGYAGLNADALRKGAEALAASIAGAAG